MSQWVIGGSESAGGLALSLTSYLVHTNVADMSTTRFDSFNHSEHNILNDIKHIMLCKYCVRQRKLFSFP